MSILRQLGEYLMLVKKDENAPQSDWLNKMHGINKISIYVFLFCIVILIAKLFFTISRAILGFLVIALVLVIGIKVYINLTKPKK